VRLTRRDVDDRRGLRAVPRLTVPMRVALEAIVLADGLPLVERDFVRAGERWRLSASRSNVRVLKRLLAEGLIEVMGLGPAVYRLTKLGRVARSLG
jgi:hypothetical protein